MRQVVPGLALIACVAALLATVVGLHRLCSARDGGHFVYPLDDAYIHLSIARTLVETGAWEATPGGGGSASSSPGWTLLIAAADRAFGINELTPLILATGFGVGALLAAYWIARLEGFPAWVAAAMLAAILLAAPLAPLAMTGMEHLCQIFVDLCFLHLAVREAHREALPETGAARRSSRLRGAMLLAFAAAAMLIRFEGIFLVLVACLVLAFRRRWALALAVGAAGYLPLAAFSLWSIRSGRLWLPNSVLLKGNVPDFHSWLRGCSRSAATPR